MKFKVPRKMQQTELKSNIDKLLQGAARLGTQALIGAACLSGVAALTGCEVDEDKKLSAAQNCLDAATTASQADVCVAYVSGLTSQSSYLIRCSADFLAQGFTGARFASAFQKISSNTGGSDPMVTMMGYFVFASTLPAHTADIAVSNCTLSGVRSMQRLATAAQLATTVAAATGGVSSFDPTAPGFDANTMLTRIQTLAGNGDTATQTTLGTIAISASSAFCNTGSAYSSTEVCTNLTNAINAGGSSALTIGQQLLAQLQTNSGK